MRFTAGRGGWLRSGHSAVTAALPYRLGGAEQGMLHLADEDHQIAGAGAVVAKEIRIEAGMAQIQQQSHFFGREAEQMLLAVVGDFHRKVQGDFSL